ncbi:MAG: beta-lactamase family protein [Saprospiraceae bacterium]|nr:beta-lactamase family protein [Saprospiraceae bacterium]
MKDNKFNLFLGLCALLFVACASNDVVPPSFYACSFSNPLNSASHPKAEIYQGLLEDYRKKGLVGATLLVRDKDGLWIGADGKADIESDIDLQACNSFLIASISKVFTSAAVYRYIDKDILSLEDPISQWLDPIFVEEVKNADQAQIKHLLAHTSGIADYYTNAFELDRINKVNNDWSKEEVLGYVFGKKATNSVGQTYAYSNTNFLLLAMILERASGLSFEEVYRQEVFAPLGLTTAYYNERNPLPVGVVKGYVDIYGNGQFVESAFLYGDEIGIGGDGGIAINAFDLATFFEEMMKGNLISQSSLDRMTEWFDLPEDWHWDEFGQTESGFGIEKFNTPFGEAVGHSGGVDGFSSLALYFPEEDMTYILLVNSNGNAEGSEAEEALGLEVLEEMFR